MALRREKEKHVLPPLVTLGQRCEEQPGGVPGILRTEKVPNPRLVIDQVEEVQTRQG